MEQRDEWASEKFAGVRRLEPTAHRTLKNGTRPTPIRLDFSLSVMSPRRDARPRPIYARRKDLMFGDPFHSGNRNQIFL